MSKKASEPVLGSLIDDGTLELVDVLGVGGYGIVYRAIDIITRRSYAVKCLTSVHAQSSARRHLHIREITLHQIASAHPAIVTLHRVVEDHGHTFVIMDYAPDSDLFTQILHQCRYLGDDALIKHVFLQILDAVHYCHSLGIYHRDLKPENVLCFDHGYRVAITDFGLATTEKSSTEFRTGSVYHMSPGISLTFLKVYSKLISCDIECQFGDSIIPSYSPMHNDIWSLGIILLNLTTGRNPWKSATSDDPTYEAYVNDPDNFLMNALPISEELNDILVQVLETNWTARMSLTDLRNAVERITTFYADNVIFEGSLARCPWESGIDLGNGTPNKLLAKRSVPPIPERIEPCCVFSMSTSLGSPYESSARSSCSSDLFTPATPCSLNQDEHDFARVRLDVDPTYHRQRHFQAKINSTSFLESSWEESDEEDCFTSFMATPASKINSDTRPIDDSRTRKRFSMPNPFVHAEPLVSRFSSDYNSISPVQSYQMTVDEPHVDSPDILVFSDVQAPRGGSKPIDIVGRRGPGDNMKSSYIFNPLRFFPRSAGCSWLTPKSSPLTVPPVP